MGKPTYTKNTIMKFNTKKVNKPTQLERTCIENAESIEQMIRRCVENKEPIESVSAPIYTEKKDGVLPQYDIRTDRMEIARQATDKFAKTIRAKTDENPFKTLKEEGIKLATENNKDA